ncbi:hypothetical protein RFI_16751, partial [Reticulomyxa filosa]
MKEVNAMSSGFNVLSGDPPPPLLESHSMITTTMIANAAKSSADKSGQKEASVGQDGKSEWKREMMSVDMKAIEEELKYEYDSQVNFNAFANENDEDDNNNNSEDLTPEAEKSQSPNRKDTKDEPTSNPNRPWTRSQ